MYILRIPLQGQHKVFSDKTSDFFFLSLNQNQFVTALEKKKDESKEIS